MDSEQLSVYMKWITRFKQRFCSKTNVTITITVYSALRSNHHVLVEKVPGRITILAPKPLKNDNPSIRLTQMSCIPPVHTSEQRLWIDFLLQISRSEDLYGFKEAYWGRSDLSFDGYAHIHPAGQLTFARILLRSARLGEPREAQSNILKNRRMTSGDWISAPKKAKNGVKLLAAFEAVVPHPVCELCPLRASHTCGHCCGAWYCGREHQKSHWKSHKPFC